MPSIAISSELNEFRLNAVIAFLSGGAENARAEIYDGVRPALGGTPAGNLLASIVLMEPLGTFANGLLSVATTNEVMIGNTGHPATGSPRYAHELNLPGLRCWSLARYPYLVFYVEHPDHIDVWRLLHGQRDIPAWMQAQEGT